MEITSSPFALETFKDTMKSKFHLIHAPKTWKKVIRADVIK
jgi:hypothetical protein